MIDIRRFRFSLWPTLMSVPAVIVMIGLGVWQLDRLAWKTALMDRIAERTAQQPVPFERLSQEPAQDEYTPVRLRGSFVHDKELYLAARSRNNNVGFHVITPFVLTNGMAVLVIEHNTRFVSEFCKHVHVLDSGRLIANGTPQDVMRNPEVIAAYLGD